MFELEPRRKTHWHRSWETLKHVTCWELSKQPENRYFLCLSRKSLFLVLNFTGECHRGFILNFNLSDIHVGQKAINFSMCLISDLPKVPVNSFQLTFCSFISNTCMKEKRLVQALLFPLRWRRNGHGDVSNHQPHHCLFNRLFGFRSKKTSKLCVTGLCAGNSPGTGEFPAQMASNAENVSIWWRHHAWGSLRQPWHIRSHAPPPTPDQNVYHARAHFREKGGIISMGGANSRNQEKGLFC